MRREGTKGRVWAVGGSDNNNIESREEGGVKKKAFAEVFRICDEQCHPKCLAQVRGINPLDRPCETMKKGESF